MHYLTDHKIFLSSHNRVLDLLFKQKNVYSTKNKITETKDILNTNCKRKLF